jgi:hypothetical protein
LKKIKIQVIGGPNNQLQTPLYVKANLIPVKNAFLDQCVGVLDDPSVINDNSSLSELINVQFNIDEPLYNNTSVELISNPSNGVVNTKSVRVLNSNYFYGSTFKKCTLDNLPVARKIMIDEDAKRYLSGGILVQNNKVMGIVSMGSTDEKDKNISSVNSKCVAIDIKHSIAWMMQCCDAVFKFTQNNLEKIKSLGDVSIMKTLKDDVMPGVLNLGAVLMNYYYANSCYRQTNGVRIVDLHRFLNITENLKPLSIQKHDSIQTETILNTNEEFVDWFYNDQQDTKHYIVAIRYIDRLSGNPVYIDFLNDSLNANLNDWSFRGDSQAPLDVTIQSYTRENNDTTTASPKRTFTFNANRTSDSINGENYYRQTTEVCGAYFSDLNAYMLTKFNYSYIVDNNVLKENKYNYLWDEDDSQYCLAGVALLELCF